MKVLTVVLTICILNITGCSNDNVADKNQIQELQQTQSVSQTAIPVATATSPPTISSAATVVTSLKRVPSPIADLVDISTLDRYQSCPALADKIKTLNISSENIILPQNTEFPEGSKIIDIYEAVPLGQGDPLMCWAKVKIANGNYPVRISLITENNSEYIVIESQGKRKWILKWLND